MTNGGFESGDASHWSFSGDAFTTGVDATSATIHAFIPSGSNIAAVDLDDFLLEGGLADSATATPTRLAVTKEGNGTLTLTGTSTHQLATAVKDGTLRLDGTFTSSAVIVDPGATLTGQGSLPAATIGGTLMLDAVRGPLAITGALVLADATLAKAELGWSPAFGALETQIEHAWDWLCRRHPAVAAPRPPAQIAGVATD